MGRHATAAGRWTAQPAPTRRQAEERAIPSPARSGRPRRAVLSLFAMTAIAGIALVSVIEPYAGATAESYYQEPALASASGVQRYDVAGGYVLIDPTRDVFRTVTGDGAGDPGPSAGGGAATPVGVAQVYAAKSVAAKGWAPSEFACLVRLWGRESGWSTHAANPSGAYGIPQALPGSKMGAGWQDDYRVQIDWGIGYIASLYGSPCGALGHSNAKGWY